MPELTRSKPVPTLYEWAGGIAALRRLTDTFYAKVPGDPVLAPVFAHMGTDHPQHVAAFVAEVFGGPTAWSDGGESHASMISRHLNRQLTQAQRRRWVDLMLDSLDEAGLPDDPEFRAAIVGYLEWGTRLAVINSAEGVPEPSPEMPMPTWDWGPPGGPWPG